MKSFLSTDLSLEKNDSWLTPLTLIARLSMDAFDLDPCGFANHCTAKKKITLPGGDGLKAKWSGKIWLNPPYSNAEPWLTKLSQHGYGVALVFARTGTAYMQAILRAADHVQFIKGRISFIRPDGGPSQNAGADSMAIFFGCKPADPSLGVVLSR